MKNEKILALKSLFEKNTILLMNDICAIFKETTMRTIIRYLNEIGYYSSYNRNGMYYTITGIPKFDSHGLWGYKEALFSSYGSLKRTICVQTEKSNAGMTNGDLAALLQVDAKSILTALAAGGAVSRGKSRGVYVYYSTDPTRRVEQESHRAELDKAAALDALFNPYDIVDVLSAYIKGIKTPEQVGAHLRHMRHSISNSVVAAIFERYELEHDAGGKKTAFKLAKYLADAIRALSESHAQWIERTVTGAKFHTHKWTAICTVCGTAMVVEKTTPRSISTMAMGKIVVMEYVMVCPGKCVTPNGTRYRERSPELSALVARGANYGYDIEVFVGMQRFMYNRQRLEIKEMISLSAHLDISDGEISALEERYLVHLERLHTRNTEALKDAMLKDGGYPYPALP